MADKKQFYAHIHSNVDVVNIKGMLAPQGWEDIILQKEKLSFVDTNGKESYDGPCMLKVLLKEINLN